MWTGTECSEESVLLDSEMSVRRVYAELKSRPCVFPHFLSQMAPGSSCPVSRVQPPARAECQVQGDSCSPVQMNQIKHPNIHKAEIGFQNVRRTQTRCKQDKVQKEIRGRGLRCAVPWTWEILELRLSIRCAQGREREERRREWDGTRRRDRSVGLSQSVVDRFEGGCRGWRSRGRGGMKKKSVSRAAAVREDWRGRKFGAVIGCGAEGRPRRLPGKGP